MSRFEIEEQLAEDFALSNLTKNTNQISMSKNIPAPRALINLTPNEKKTVGGVLLAGAGAFGFHEVAGGVKDLSGTAKNLAEAYKDIHDPEEVNINLPEMPKKLGVTSLTPTPYNNVNRSTMPAATSDAAAIDSTITSGNTTLPTAPVQTTDILPNY